MAKQVASYRIDADLLEWLGEYAKSRGASQGVIVEESLRHFRELSRAGVPDLPVTVAPKPKPKPAHNEPVPSLLGMRQAALAKQMGWIK